MAKIVVFYFSTEQQEEFEDYYFNKHIPIAKKVPFIKNLEVHKVLKTNNKNYDFYLHGEIEFESIELLNLALESKEGKEMLEDGKKLWQFFDTPPISAILN